MRHREDLREVSRNPLQLVCDTDDALARYVVLEYIVWRDIMRL